MEDRLLLKLATPIISQHTSPDCNEKLQDKTILW
jgi:hypothetical protein